MQIFFNLLVIFADIRITVAVVSVVMETSTYEGWCLNYVVRWMFDSCARLYQDDNVFPPDEPELIYLNWM